MHKTILTLAILTLSSIILFALPCAANNMMNTPTQINHSIYSTQAAQPLNTLERSYYTNSEIRRIEEKHRSEIQPSSNDSEIIPINDEKKSLKGLFKGFRVIY